MKKVMGSLLVAMLLLGGCSSSNTAKKEEKQVEKEEKIEVVEETGLNHDEMMKNNRSSIAGDYVNSKGEIITVNTDATLNFHDSLEWEASNQIASEIHQDELGVYQWSLTPADSPVGGGGVMIFPAGVEITGLALNEEGIAETDENGYFKKVILPSDNTKIRMTNGQGIPSADDVYTKK